MTLSELLSSAPRRQKIRLGTADGYGFLYRGMVKNCHFEQLMNREVVNTYAGLVDPDQLVVIIEGNEKGLQYNPKMPPLTKETISDEMVTEIVGLVYKELADGLIYAYGHKDKVVAVKMERDELQARLDELKAQIDELNEEIVRIDFALYETEIMDVPFGKGAEIIKECKRLAKTKENHGETLKKTT